MTIRELKDKLEGFEDDTIVVAYTPEKDYLVDVFIEEVNVSFDGSYSKNNKQNFYTEGGFGETAVLVSIEPPKKRY